MSRPLMKALLAAAALSLVLVGATAVLAKDKTADPTAPAAAAPTAGSAKPTTAPPAAPRKATPQQRAEAERLDPLARAAFWANEVAADPRDVDAGAHLAAALRTLGRNQEAALAAQQALVVDPGDKGALMEEARAFVAGGQGFYAIDPLTRLGGKDAKDWRVLSLLGVAFEQVARGEEAEAAWRRALELSPDNPSVLSNLALHAAAQGRAGEAETLLRRASIQPGAGIQVRQNLALVLGLEGKLAEAETIQRQDLPPELADANMAYLRAAAAGAAPVK
jgi:Flp pilus assembly protein TadD